MLTGFEFNDMKTMRELLESFRKDPNISTAGKSVIRDIDLRFFALLFVESETSLNHEMHEN